MSDKKQPISIFNPFLIISTLFWVGKFKYFPGTLGSIVPAAEFYFYLDILQLKNLGSYFVHLIIMIPILTIAVYLYVKNLDDKDPSEVVADEYVGQYIAQLFSYSILSIFFDDINILSLVIVSFIWFRIFDIVKPSLVGYCDKKLKGVLAIMLDDVVAGIFSALVTIMLFSIYYVIS